MLNDALRFAKLGFPVFPLSVGSKIPWGGTNGVKDATRDPDKIREAWLKHPNSNIGLALGQEASVVAIDLDKGATDADLARFPRTVTARSKNGWHLFFRWSTTAKNVKEFTLPREDGSVGPSVNVRSDGLYVVGVGSVVADWEYRWHSDAGGELSPADVQYAEIPAWVLPGSSSSRNDASSTQSAQAPTPTGERSDGKVYGDNTRHAFFVKAATAARKEGKQFDEILAKLHLLNQTNCVPPKANCHDELTKIVQWVFGKTQVDSAGTGEPERGDRASGGEHAGKRKRGRPSSGFVPYELAQQFVEEINLRVDSTYRLRYSLQEFLRHKNRR